MKRSERKHTEVDTLL